MPTETRDQRRARLTAAIIARIRALQIAAGTRLPKDGVR